ncbi:hypothetical protein [Curtobacterium sp. MCJR17_043]|uniref:hypothetical protein n=1 Tax=Curtobacterium sp. MCJR17_043 TaxID=2175660 RepID=UPI0024DF73CB|nr:hypothetical protein [Curtobacterium sp. MCJR17_043]WIB35659.1 hypothetical protein DEJ15_16165 [Curtobacterium sp. MCJR17_043]
MVSAEVLSGTAGLGLASADRQGLAQGIVPTGLGPAASAAARDAFLGGMHTAFVVAGVVAVVVAVLAAVFVRSGGTSAPAAVLEETVEATGGHA